MSNTANKSSIQTTKPASSAGRLRLLIAGRYATTRIVHMVRVAIEESVHAARLAVLKAAVRHLDGPDTAGGEILQRRVLGRWCTAQEGPPSCPNRKVDRRCRWRWEGRLLSCVSPVCVARRDLVATDRHVAMKTWWMIEDGRASGAFTASVDWSFLQKIWISVRMLSGRIKEGQSTLLFSCGAVA